MEILKTNIMATEPIKKVLVKIGFPMIISMVLQALYNVVDSIFVTNIKDNGALANEALTYAFPIQILIIAIGVGTGVGLNSMLSKKLGENDKEKVNKIAGNGIFLAIVIYLFFLLFGLFGSKWFISLFTDNSMTIELGTSYLMICTTLSFGAIGFTIYERLLQATGKSIYSTIAQISGAIINVVFDYIFIFVFQMNVKGAALATVLGQFVSLFIAMFFHYLKNKEISGNLKYIKPNFSIIKSIYSIGISAALMQGLLSLMMALMNLILNLANADSTILVGAFGIYYKIQQIALFSCFGMSNAIITILSFNYGLNDKKRCLECIKYGILDTLIVSLCLTILFEIFAEPLTKLFALSNTSSLSLINTCKVAIRVASIGYIFMGFNIAIQGILQAFMNALKPFISALLRLIVFVIPIAYLFVLTNNVMNNVWFTFPIAELLTSIVSFIFLKQIIKKINTF